MAPKVRDMQAQMAGLQGFVFPALDSMFYRNSKHYPYEETFADARWNPVVILQSSGSTGTVYTPGLNTGLTLQIQGPPNPSK